ncbi:helix-turn-helix domain-containing protein [Halostagnicola bangensis]
MSGLSATIVLKDAPRCPIARVSDEAGTTVDSVARSSIAAPDTPAVEEFTIDAEESTGFDAEDNSLEMTTVSETERTETYRFARGFDDPCPCEVIEEDGTPVSSIRAVNGALFLTIRAIDVDSMSAIIHRLHDHFDGVRLHELVQVSDESAADPVLVDRAQLTDRQRDVLETAFEMGYFDYPKGANASEVASALDISRSTVTEHLATAQTKVLKRLLESQIG